MKVWTIPILYTICMVLHTPLFAITVGEHIPDIVPVTVWYIEDTSNALEFDAVINATNRRKQHDEIVYSFFK